MAAGNARIAVFYHVAQMGSWEAVDAEIMRALRMSGLLSCAGIFVRNVCSDVSLFEFPTIEMMRGFAASADCAVLYLHTKGVTNPSPQSDDWRACMLYWMVTRWRECVERLRDHDAVGINVIDTPLLHFQGNFWWATTAHIRKLGPPYALSFRQTALNQFERHKAEFWVLSKQAKLYTPYHHKIDPYATRNPRSSYEGLAF
jgi:hypothetical protein